MKRGLLTLVGFTLMLGTIGAIVIGRSEQVQDAVLRRAIANRTGAERNDLHAADRLNIVFCGTGSPLPDPGRGTPCVAVFAGNDLYLIDAGEGAARRLASYQIPLGGLSGILFTHFHSDHIGGIGDVVLTSWASGRVEPLKLYGPEGIEKIADGFTTAYALDAGYRTAHHGAEVMPPSGGQLEAVRIDVAGDSDVVTVIETNDLLIRAFRVDHSPIEPAYGYRVDYKGRSVIFSGDTIAHDNMVSVGRDVDVMVHEALASHMVSAIAASLESLGDKRRSAILTDTLNYHATPVDAALTANKAGAGLLVYSHIVPPLPNRIAELIFLRGVDAVRDGPTVVGYDGLHLELPAGSDQTAQHCLN